MLEQPAPQDREEDLDLVQPRGVSASELKAPARVSLEPLVHVLDAGGKVVGDRHDLLAVDNRDLLVELCPGSGSG